MKITIDSGYAVGYVYFRDVSLTYGDADKLYKASSNNSK